MNDLLEMRLTDPNAARQWNGYLKTLRKYRPKVVVTEWNAFEEDIQLHALDCLNHASDDVSQEEVVRGATDSLGPADKIAQEFLAQASLSRRNLTSSLTMQGIGAGASLLRAVVLSIAVVFAVMGIVHLFNQDVGIWIHGRGDWTLSFERQADATQVFREMFSVIAIAFSLLLVGLWRLLGLVLHQHHG